MRTIALAWILAAFIPLASAQTMYKWVDKQGKTHYTDSPPPDDAKSLAPPRSSAPREPVPAPAASKAGGGDAKARTQSSFRREEQDALQVMCGIVLLEVFTCQAEHNRWCSMDELVKGINGDRSKRFERDPRADPNYDYRVEVRGSEMSISAVPRKAGLAGFFNSGQGAHYNLAGAAGKADPRIAGTTTCGS